MHSTLCVEGIELVCALALLLGADLRGARKRPFECSLQLYLTDDLAADVADDEPPEPHPQAAATADDGA